MQFEQVLQIPLTLKYWFGQVEELQSLLYSTLVLIQVVQLDAVPSQFEHGLVQLSHLLFTVFLKYPFGQAFKHCPIEVRKSNPEHYVHDEPSLQSVH